MSKTNKTKAELAEENSQLKSKLRELLSQIRVKKDSGELNQPAISVFFDKETKQFQLVELKYNVHTRQAEVIDVRPAHKNDKDFALAMLEGKKFFVEQIMDKLDI